MRKLILFLLVFASAKVSAQVYQELPQYGYRANRMAFDSTLQIPTVCGVPTLKSIVKTNKSGAIAYDSCNARFYAYNPKTLTWTAITGGSTDTTSLSNRINLKIDSLKRSNDSVYAYRNGTRVFQYKDSVGGGGGNFWKTSGTTTLSGADTIVSDNGTLIFIGGSEDMARFSVQANNIDISTSGGDLKFIGLDAINDTTNYKPLVINLSTGAIEQSTSWVSGGGGIAVDTIFRTLGKDSIFYKKNNITYAIKDSVGGGAFLPLSGGTLTGNLNGTTATFSSSGSSNTFNINHTSGSGHGLEITKAGNGEGIIVNKTSGSGNAVTITGTLNATTLVKNGGTSSQFLKADGSVDATTYVSDTSALQRKSIPAFSILANNTNATANVTAQNFKQFGNQTYTDSITFTGATTPSGSTNHSFRYSQIGNLVTLHITLTYATTGSLSQVAIEIPDGLPAPILPTGLTANNDIIAYGTGYMVTNTTGVAGVFSKVFLRQNTGLTNNYEVVINQGANASYRIFNATIQYFAQ